MELVPFTEEILNGKLLFCAVYDQPILAQCSISLSKFSDGLRSYRNGAIV